MRLLNTSTMKIEEFFGNAIPLYAILSHTWGAEEVTLQDMLGNIPSYKKGFQKLSYSCTQARSDGLAYIWIDTCCIDKTSSAELSEAINSMYRWYNESVYCYIYLSDVLDFTDYSVPGSSFRESRWFTRGWTLQELVASETRIFFSASWQAIGCVNWDSWKKTQSGRVHNAAGLPELETLLAEITGIDVEVLKGSRLSDVSIARRMSWAAKRKTTRTEDTAYCLMGIFDVNMPLLYGEGEKAFIRLQEEILKSSDDESLFAHSISSRRLKFDSFRFSSLLAQTPACFSGWANIGMCQSASRGLLASSVPASLTSKGLRVRLPLCYNIGHNSEFNEDVVLALLDCRVGEDGLARLSIPLARLPYSRDQYLRLDPTSLRVLSPRDDGPGSASLVTYRNGKPQKGALSASVQISDVRLETIYVVSEEYIYSAEERTIMPYFRLKGVLQPPGSSLVLENVCPRQWWDDEVGILQTPIAKRSNSGWVSGVLHFRDKETGLGLDIILGTSPGETKIGQSEQPSLAFPEPWCRISGVNYSASNVSNSSDTRLSPVFEAAERYFRDNALYRMPVPSTPWIGSLLAKVKLEPAEFLGRQGFLVQVDIS